MAAKEKKTRKKAAPKKAAAKLENVATVQKTEAAPFLPPAVSLFLNS